MSSNKDYPDARKLSEDARKSVGEAFEALNQWRDEMAQANERYSGKVFDQMAKATRSMGWPDELVEASRDHLKNTTNMQLQMMDKVMDAWRQQIRNADSGLLSPQDFAEQMKSFQNMTPGGMGQFPGMPDMSQFTNMPMAPFQFWMQAADMWQKNMATAMSMWMSGAEKMAKSMDPNKR